MKKNLTSDVEKLERPQQKGKVPADELKKSVPQSRASKMKKTNQQSRSGWGGRRDGAGAPLGNTNAVKHGERSRMAFLPLYGGEPLPPLVSMRANNLIIAGRVGELQISNPEPGSAAWRELMLLDGIMWQHTRRIARISLRQVNQELEQAKKRHRDTNREMTTFVNVLALYTEIPHQIANSQKISANKTANSQIAKSENGRAALYNKLSSKENPSLNLPLCKNAKPNRMLRNAKIS